MTDFGLVEPLCRAYRCYLQLVNDPAIAALLCGLGPRKPRLS